MNLIDNYGMQRFSQEFRHKGSHGYADGVGSASHTFYHHLDLVLWLLQTAPGNVAKIKLTVPYIFRIKDYLKQKKYRHTAQYLQIEYLLEEEPSHKDSILNAEFDFNVNFTLLDQESSPCGFMQIVNCYSGFCHRELAYYDEITCPQSYLESGRMKQSLFDLHQGSIQHLRLIRDNKWGDPYHSHLIRRTHQRLGIAEGKLEQAYEDEPDQKSDQYIELIQMILLQWSGKELLPEEKRSLSGFFNQSLSFETFGKIYELIAEDSERRNNHDHSSGSLQVISLF